MNDERSVTDVLQDILRDLQEIVRAEVRLAKVEICDDAARAASSAMWIAAGLIVAVTGWVFLLWTTAYLLATRASMWTATLVVAVVMAGIASMLIIGGIRRLKRIQPIPERAVASMKGNLEWMKQSTK